MFSFLRNALSADKIQSIEKQVIEQATAGNEEAAWQALQPLLRAQRDQDDVARCLLSIVTDRHLPIERALTVLTDIHDAYSADEALLGLIGEALEGARDIDLLNSAPPDNALFTNVADRLAEIAEQVRGSDAEKLILGGLATAARMLSRQRDDLAQKSHARLVELNPQNSTYHYNHGLFLKTRGRFREGMVANQTAANLVDEPLESIEWNLGICATGAGESDVALEVWKRMDQKIEIGRFGLPDGGYPQCKVRLAERPLAERGADTDDPGLEETVWIQRLSPCHGVVRSVLYQNLGVDYGDVVLIDGAPITYHLYENTRIPVFPHLATLVRSKYQFFDFAGTQDESGRLADSSADLDEDTIVYSHTENFEVLCASCWRDPDNDHEHHEGVEKHVVVGRIAAPRHFDPVMLLHQLDSAMIKRKPCHIYVPQLCERAGLHDRAAVERHRFEMLSNN